MSEQILYSDPIVTAFLPEKPFCKGHIKIKFSSEKKYQDRNDKEIEHLFFTSSYSAAALFELLGAHGTNIILTDFDGEDTFIDVLARFDKDNLNFMWTPNRAEPQELSELGKSIKDNIDIIKWEMEHPNEAKKDLSVKKDVEEIKEEVDEKGEKKINYLLKSLNRRL